MSQAPKSKTYRKGINAAAWFANQSFNGRFTVEAPAKPENPHASDCPIWVGEACSCETAKEVK